MITNLRAHFPDRRTLLLTCGVSAPCVMLLVLGIWIMRQDRELAEKRAADDHGRIATLAGQELSARLERLMVRAVTGEVKPADRDIALVGSLESGAVRFPWQREAASLADREPIARARATLLSVTALHKAGRDREASAAGRGLLAMPAHIADEYGVPYFFYAAKRIAGSPEASPDLLRNLEAALNGAWLPPAATYMIADIARQTGRAGDATQQRALARAKEIERAMSMLSEIASRGSPPRISLDAEEGLLASMAEAGGGKKIVAAVRASSVLNSISLPSGARWAMGSGNGGLPVSDAAPQLKIQFVGPAPNESFFPRQLLYAGALGLVFLTTALSAFLLYRDMRRQAGLARLRSAFVSSVSHELRTPIATIRAYAEMLDMGRIEAAQRPAYLKTIIGESERLGRLVEGVLEFSRLEQGKRTYRFEPVPLNEVIQSAAQAMHCALEQNGFQLRIDSQSDLCVSADRHAMEQVFINLLSNAIKYSAARREIDLGVRQEGGNAIVQIRDYGVGIALEHQERIFERFYRAEAPDGRRVPGVGLGLSIVEQIVTAHGGRVAVESAPREGSAFSVILPLHA